MLTGIIGPVGPAYGKPGLREPTGDYFEAGNHQPSLWESPVQWNQREPMGDNFAAENYHPSPREPTGSNAGATVSGAKSPLTRP